MTLAGALIAQGLAHDGHNHDETVYGKAVKVFDAIGDAQQDFEKRYGESLFMDNQCYPRNDTRLLAGDFGEACKRWMELTKASWEVPEVVTEDIAPDYMAETLGSLPYSLCSGSVNEELHKALESCAREQCPEGKSEKELEGILGYFKKEREILLKSCPPLMNELKELLVDGDDEYEYFKLTVGLTEKSADPAPTMTEFMTGTVSPRPVGTVFDFTTKFEGAQQTGAPGSDKSDDKRDKDDKDSSGERTSIGVFTVMGAVALSLAAIAL